MMEDTRWPPLVFPHIHKHLCMYTCITHTHNHTITYSHSRAQPISKCHLPCDSIYRPCVIMQNPRNGKWTRDWLQGSRIGAEEEAARMVWLKKETCRTPRKMQLLWVKLYQNQYCLCKCGVQLMLVHAAETLYHGWRLKQYTFIQTAGAASAGSSCQHRWFLPRALSTPRKYLLAHLSFLLWIPGMSFGFLIPSNVNQIGLGFSFVSSF